MKFASPLVRGRLVRRYKRFLADVVLDTGEDMTCTCANTGSMLGLAAPGAAVWLSESDSKTRKYRHTWELVEADLGTGPTLVGINTGHPNKIVAEAIRNGQIPSLGGYARMKPEQKYGVSSRIDILLDDDAKGRAYVEVKNVHLMRHAGLAEFPDSVTERGAKHLAELSAMVAEGHRAVMVFLVQRGDAERFAIARDIDPKYAAALEAAGRAGVEMLALACRLSPDEITVDRQIPIELR
ncbi:MAG: DNA/RNA nuclease SfsA [Hyphomicrobiaceae bacterium]